MLCIDKNRFARKIVFKSALFLFQFDVFVFSVKVSLKCITEIVYLFFKLFVFVWFMIQIFFKKTKNKNKDGNCVAEWPLPGTACHFMFSCNMIVSFQRNSPTLQENLFSPKSLCFLGKFWHDEKRSAELRKLRTLILWLEHNLPFCARF